MKGLYRNELLKILRQTGFKVVIIIVLALAVLAPVFLATVDGLFSYSYFDDDINYYLSWAEEFPEDSIDRAYYLYRAERARFFADHQLTNSWKYEQYGSRYEELLGYKAGYTYFAAHPDANFDDVVGYFGLHADCIDDSGNILIPAPQTEGGFDDVSDWSDFDFYEDFYEDGDVIYDKYGTFVPPDQASVKEYIRVVSDYLKEYENTILNATAVEFYEARKLQYQRNLQEYRQIYDQYKAELATYEKNSYEWLKVDYTMQQWEISIQGQEQLIKSCDYLIEKHDDPDSWRHAVAFDVMGSVYEEIGNTIVVSEPFYDALLRSGDEQYMYRIYDTNQSYSEYLSIHEPEAKSARQALEMAEYSIAHDIPLTGSADSGAATLKSTLSFTIGIVGIFMIVAIAMTVANEHSNGTIRLLLIRPRSRRKILLSKYLAVLTYSYGILMAALLWQFAICALFFGGGELLSSTVCLLGGKVFAIPTVLWMLGYALFLSLSGWMLMAITLLLAVASKRASLSILLPVIARTLFSGASLISIVMITELPKASFLKYTFLPYLDLSYFVNTPVDRFVSGSGDLLTGFFGMSGIPVSGFPLWIGLLWIVGFIVLFSILSFTCFRRQQIKS